MRAYICHLRFHHRFSDRVLIHRRVYVFFKTKQKQETLTFVVWICSLRLAFRLKKGVKDY